MSKGISIRGFFDALVGLVPPRIRLFNFRDVLKAEGIDCTDTAMNWDVGRLLQRELRKRGVEPMRVLTEKTNPNPSVSAPHCIAHYPMEYFLIARKLVRVRYEYEKRQLSFAFDEETDDD